MSRLIDADELKKNCKIDGSFENNFQCVSLDTLGRVIDKQPTAYDIDKVVEELEDELKTAEKTYRSYNMNVDLGRTFGLERAIEIVKAGGKNG